jgi:hypothetical protein
MRNATRRARWWTALIAAATLLIGLVLPAAAVDLYRIDGVPVDATAESGVAARELAIANGQREALVRLMRRLTSPTAHGQLPDVSNVPIARYVNSFEIAEERVGPNQYLGVINVSFIAERVRDLLASAGIPYVRRRSDPILVIPVTDLAGRPEVWLEASPWRAAWDAGIEAATVIVVALPLGDLADIAAAPPSAVAAGDPVALEALATRYGAITVVVATARAAGPSLAGPIAIDLRRSDDWNQPIFRSTVELPTEGDPQVVLKPVVAEAVLALEDDWKRRTAEQAAEVATVPMTVPLADLASWVQIRRELTRLPEVRWVSVDSFTQSRARVTIGHLGDLQRLTAAVGRVGLSLTEESEGLVLRPAELTVAPEILPESVVTP